ncbi:hypothetical protein IAU60_001195 [Kwoniella sp. DSM 27419]
MPAQGLAINPLDYKSTGPRDPSRKCAWVVFLLSSASYLPGVLVLHHSLKKYQSAFPLIVAVNPAVPPQALDALRQAGLEIRTVRPMLPAGKVTTIAERFVDTWTKCALLEFTEYERLVLIDGDMMLRQNMDELFDFPLEPDHIAATFGCICNLDRSTWAPDYWTRENCGWTQSHHPTAITHPGPALPTGPHSMLNSGIVVLAPSMDKYNALNSFLTSTDPAVQDKIANWMFPDQDLLQEFWGGKWVSLPWIYNAVKTMRYWHGNFYRDQEVRNLHYIVDKPWKRRPSLHSVEDKQRTGLTYKVDHGDFAEIKDATLGIPAPHADAITHGWWWEEYNEMVDEMKQEGNTSLDYLESLVDPGLTRGTDQGHGREPAKQDAIDPAKSSIPQTLDSMGPIVLA